MFIMRDMYISSSLYPLKNLEEPAEAPSLKISHGISLRLSRTPSQPVREQSKAMR